MMESGRTRGSADLLRDVYEENLNFGRPLRQSSTDLTLQPPWRNRLLLLTAFMFAAFGGVGIESSTQEPVEPATPDEQIMQRFGMDSDPGIQLSADAEESLASVYGLGIKTIVIDPGHGGHDPGAVGPSGITEKAITLDVARRLGRRLQAHGLTVRLTRYGDTAMTLKERVFFAIRENADILVSVHVNALESDPRSVVETYYFHDWGTAATRRVAARENGNSGFTISEWRTQLRALASTVKQEESRRLAESVQKAMYTYVRGVNPDVEDWGAKGGPFAVLSDRWYSHRAPGQGAIPAILAEISVINHAYDESLLLSDAYREGIAGALFNGILNFAVSGGSEAGQAGGQSVSADPAALPAHSRLDLP